MAEPWLPLERRIARWDATGDQLHVTGWTAGPAGLSAIELETGLWVAVDHAAPATLSELTVDLVDRRVPDRLLDPLASLLGEEATEELQALAGAGTDSGSGTARPVPIGAGRRGWSSADDELGSRRPLPFARVTVAADLGDDAGRSLLARGVALVEASTAALDLRPMLAVRLAEQAVAALADADPTSDQKRMLSVSAVIDRLAQALRREPVGGPLRDLAGRFAGTRGGRPDLAALDARMAPGPAAAAPAAAAEIASSAAGAPTRKAAATSGMAEVRGTPLEVVGDRRAWAWLDGAGNVGITAGPGPDAWARVFRRHDRLLLGLSPVRSTYDLRATVVIPPTAPADLVVDVVTDPSPPLAAPAHDLLRLAVATGREAARLTRLGDTAAAAARWEDCARHWERLGDPQRAALARNHGQRSDGRRTRTDPVGVLVSDGLE